MKQHRAWASFKKHISHKISFHVMRVLLLKIRNLCQKALLCQSNNFQGNRVSSKVEGLYVLQNQFFRGVNFPSLQVIDRCFGILLYIHCINQMDFYH